MQFHKKTSASKSGFLIKILFKVLLLFFVVVFLVVLVDKINFPHPNKKIEKIISNENFKVVK
jgi:hypothetical protein